MVEKHRDSVALCFLRALLKWLSLSRQSYARQAGWLSSLATVLFAALLCSRLVPSLQNNIGVIWIAKVVAAQPVGVPPAVALRDDRLSDAREHLRVAVSKWPSIPRLRENLGKALWFQGNHESAVDEWQPLVAARCLSPVSAYFLGWSYVRLAQADAAAAAWRQAAIPPSLLRRIQWNARHEGNRSTALLLAEVAVLLEPDIATVWMTSAEEYDYWGLSQRAIQLWSRATALSLPTQPEHWYAAGEALRLQGRWDQALVAFAVGRRLVPQESRLWERESIGLMHLGRWEAAAEQAVAWTAAVPSDCHGYVRAGEAYYQLESYDEAKKWFEKATEIDEGCRGPYPYTRLGAIARVQGQLDLATEYLRKAIARGPSYVDAYHELAQVYFAGGNVRGAISYLSEAISLYGEECPYLWHAQLGDWYRAVGDISSAVVSYRFAVACNPGFAAGWEALRDLGGAE